MYNKGKVRKKYNIIHSTFYSKKKKQYLMHKDVREDSQLTQKFWK